MEVCCFCHEPITYLSGLSSYMECRDHSTNDIQIHIWCSCKVSAAMNMSLFKCSQSECKKYRIPAGELLHTFSEGSFGALVRQDNEEGDDGSDGESISKKAEIALAFTKTATEDAIATRNLMYQNHPLLLFIIVVMEAITTISGIIALDEGMGTSPHDDIMIIATSIAVLFGFATLFTLFISFLDGAMSKVNVTISLTTSMFEVITYIILSDVGRMIQIVSFSCIVFVIVSISNWYKARSISRSILPSNMAKSGLAAAICREIIIVYKNRTDYSKKPTEKCCIGEISRMEVERELIFKLVMAYDKAAHACSFINKSFFTSSNALQSWTSAWSWENKDNNISINFQ